MTAPIARSGTLVLVVGPSGAGKDSIIAAARTELSSDGRFVFARRTVTRPSGPWEDHDSLDVEAFAAAAAAGRFALSWTAHGLHYGLDRSIESDLRRGRTVIANVSRGIIAYARQRYVHVHVVMIAVAPDVLAARLRARGREPDAASRAGDGRPELAAADCDTVIDNSQMLATAVAAFIDTLQWRVGSHD